MKLNCSLCGTPYEFVYIQDKPLPTNFPFCSERCKSIDLGKWFNEEYRISAPIPVADNLTEYEREILTELHEETLAKLLDKDLDNE